MVLSAQATDVGVNKATAKLFQQCQNAAKRCWQLGEAGLKHHIKTIGLFNTKAKNVIALVEKCWSKNSAAKCRARARNCKACPASAARRRMWC